MPYYFVLVKQKEILIGKATPPADGHVSHFTFYIFFTSKNINFLHFLFFSSLDLIFFLGFLSVSGSIVVLI